MELKKQRQLVISFLYHVAVQRNVRNPFEDQEVVGALTLDLVDFFPLQWFPTAFPLVRPFFGANFGVA